VARGPSDPGTPGLSRFLAADADRERVIDALKTAFVQGMLTKDELAVRTGRALEARTYGHLAAVTAGLGARQPARLANHLPAPVRRRVRKKVVAWSACAIILPPVLGATFLTYYGGFVVMLLFAFVGMVLCSRPSTPSRPGPAPMSGRR
jgi:hypothetical protein